MMKHNKTVKDSEGSGWQSKKSTAEYKFEQPKDEPGENF